MPAPKQTRISPAPIQDLPRELLDDDSEPREDDAPPEAFKPEPSPPVMREETNMGILQPSDPVPGQMAQIAPVRHVPNLERVHASTIFPDLFPRPVGPQAPGVFVDPQTGQPVMPRVRKGGQFSLLMLIVQSVYGDVVPPRKVILPMGLTEQEWGLGDGDKVTRVIEVVFDFEDMRDRCLKAAGGRSKVQDPLDRRDPFGNRLDTAPIPALTVPSRGR